MFVFHFLTLFVGECVELAVWVEKDVVDEMGVVLRGGHVGFLSGVGSDWGRFRCVFACVLPIVIACVTLRRPGVVYGGSLGVGTVTHK